MRLLNILIVANLLLLLFLGSRLVFNFSIWAPIDEGSHFNYINFIAENKRLPVLVKDLASWQVLSIAEGIYPEVTTTDPAQIGLGGYLYEAFQPPLYYLTSVPTFLLSGSNFYHKIRALRIQDLIILLATLLFLWKIADQLFKNREKRDIFRVVSILVFLMPGVLLRNITISNAVLEFALAAALFYFLVVKENLWWAAIALGLLFLSRFTSIFLYGVFGFSLMGRLLIKIADEKSLRLKAIIEFLILLAIPVIILIPWFYFNWKHFGSFTANELSKAMQSDIVNPDNTDYKIRDLIPMTNTLMDTFVLPEEWGIHGHTFIRWGTNFFKVLVFFIMLPTATLFMLHKALKAVRNRGRTIVEKLVAMWEENKPPIICLMWIFLNILMLFTVIVKEDWPTRVGRYLYISIPPLIYLITEAIDFLFKERRRVYLFLLAEVFILMVWGGIYLGY